MNKRQRKKIMKRDKIIRRIEFPPLGPPCVILTHLRYNRVIKVIKLEYSGLPAEGKIRSPLYFAVPRGMTKQSFIISMLREEIKNEQETKKENDEKR